MPLKQIYTTYNPHTSPPPAPFRYCPHCRTALAVRQIDHIPRSACPACGFIHFRNPAPAICLLIVKDGCVLLGKRRGDPGKGKWATPSGYIEYHDDFLSTAVREAREETGLDIEISAILNVTSSFHAPQYHFLAVYLLASVAGGELTPGDDLETAAWFPLSGSFPELAFPEDADILTAYAHSPLTGLPVDPDFTTDTIQSNREKPLAE